MAAPQSTVLIVSESELDRELLALALHAKGIATLEAECGFQALQTLECCRIDLLVAQAEMSDLDGIELTRFVKADPQTAAIPVLLRAAEPTYGLRKHALEAGASEIIPDEEPIDLQIRRIRNLLRKRIPGASRVVILSASAGLRSELRSAVEEAGIKVIEISEPTRAGAAIEAMDSQALVFVDFRLSARQAISFIRNAQEAPGSKGSRVVLLTNGIEIDPLIQELGGGVDHFRVTPETREQVCESLKALGLWKSVAR